MLNKKHAIGVFLILKWGGWIYSTKYCLKHNKQDIVQNHMVLQLACVRVHNTQRLQREMHNHVNAKENQRALGRRGKVLRLSVRAPDYGQKKKTRKARRSCQTHLRQMWPTSSKKTKQNKTKHRFKTPMQVRYLEVWLKEKQQPELDSWGNRKALPHLSPLCCWLCRREPARLRLWLFVTFVFCFFFVEKPSRFNGIWKKKGNKSLNNPPPPWNDKIS